MESGYKFMPNEQFLVGNVLRMRLRGEPLDGVSAHCIREADVYGDDPVRLTSLFPPTNREPCEWFFFSWCKLKSKKKAHRGGRGGGRSDRQEEWRTNGVKTVKKERTVRGAGGIEIGHWRSTQSVKNVIQISGTNSGVTIGYRQNFEYRDSKKQKSEWLMEEYGILPSSEDAAGDDDKELVICKIYKTPAARRAETKKSAPSPAGAFLIPSSPELPSQHILPQQYYPWPESLQPSPPPPAFDEPLQLADVLQNWPNSTASSPAGALLIPSSPKLFSQYLSPQQYYPWPESLQPTPPPSDEPLQSAVVLQNWPNPAAHVYDDRTPAISHISQSSTAETSEHHVDNGNTVLPPAEQQQSEHAELDATANTHPEDPRLQERSAKRRKILGTFSSLFATAPPHRPTTRKAPMIAR